MNAESPAPVQRSRLAAPPDTTNVQTYRCDKRIFDVEDVPGGMVYDPHCGMGCVFDAAAAAGHFAFVRYPGSRRRTPSRCRSVFDLEFRQAQGIGCLPNPPHGRKTGRKIVELLISEPAAARSTRWR